MRRFDPDFAEPLPAEPDDSHDAELFDDIITACALGCVVMLVGIPILLVWWYS